MRRNTRMTFIHRLRKGVDAVGLYSYFVLMGRDETKGDRWLPLGYLTAHEVIVVCCSCERRVEYHSGFLQRRYRLASDTLVYDLQFRLLVRAAIGGVAF